MRFLTTTALALVLTTGAFAANHAPMLMRGDGTEAAMPAETDIVFTTDAQVQAEGYETYTDPLTIADVEEAPLYSAVTGEEIGEVEDTVSEGDQLRYLVLDVGGFLGIGEKTIAVAPDQVMAMRNPGLGDTRIYINATQEQLEQLPDYNSQAAAAMESAVGTLEGTVATDDGDVVPAETVTEENQVETDAVVAEETTQAAEVVEQEVEETDTMMADGGTDAAATTDDATVVVVEEADTTEQPVETAQATDAVTPTDSDNTMTTDGAVVTENGASPFTNRAGDMVAQPVYGDEQFVADPNYTVEGYETVGDYNTLLDEGAVEEAPLYSAVTGEEIGEVEDALTENGALSALVLDIGGFLGLGEHTITVAPDQVMYMRDPGVLSDVRVYINATKEQLEAIPSYNADL